MSVSMDQIREIFDADEVHYFLDPQQTALLAMFDGNYGTYQLVFEIAPDLEGRFLQMRAMNFGHCRRDHPHSRLFLEILASVNNNLRTVKFGWDPRDGEIAAYADFWLEDAVVTEDQFRTVLGVLLRSMDVMKWRLDAALAHGKDPGERPPAPGEEEPPQPEPADDFETI